MFIWPTLSRTTLTIIQCVRVGIVIIGFMHLRLTQLSRIGRAIRVLQPFSLPEELLSTAIHSNFFWTTRTFIGRYTRCTWPPKKCPVPCSLIDNWEDHWVDWFCVKRRSGLGADHQASPYPRDTSLSIVWLVKNGWGRKLKTSRSTCI